MVEDRVVDDRVLVTGLDEMYRSAMKRAEVGELVHCARAVAFALGVEAAPVPVDGYYAEQAELTEYFLLIRAIQETPVGRVAVVRALPQYQRLREVASSRIFGHAEERGTLLPQGRDALKVALEAQWPDWRMERLIPATARAAADTDDYSLVGIAARTGDPVLVAATRESVQLYAGRSRLEREPRVRYHWAVDPELSDAVRRFVARCNALLHESLPAPIPENAQSFWDASDRAWIVGRCACLGSDDRGERERFYHWAIDPGDRDGPVAREFWAEEQWTTELYERSLSPAPDQDVD